MLLKLVRTLKGRINKMNKTKEALLRRLPKRYHERVVDFTPEEGLIDDCKYILQYSKDYMDGDCEGGTLPCRSIKDACYIVRDVLAKVVK